VARLGIERASKAFGPTRAIKSITLEVPDGEFIAVLGPSGCGKTTLLRLVAGFERLDEGAIAIGRRIVSAAGTHIPPEERHVGIVFQSYALWPHMTVAENVAYGLKVARVGSAERTRRVEAALAVVGLDGMGERRPAMLSGGQRQRVALARCLVTEPSLVLLDEPLANLDVHLRASMEAEFADFHRRTGRTMLYITHDQAEAMALADRIAIMDDGVLIQVASPSELFREPATEMVARFIGEGIVIPASLQARHAEGGCTVRLLGVDIRARCRPDQSAAESVKVCLRPRDLAIAGEGAGSIPCRVRNLVYQGGYFRVEAAPQAAPEIDIVLHAPEPISLQAGDAFPLAIAPGSAWVIPDALGPAV
jgi:iron(III) transport system ATP-binding protein